MVCVKIFTSYCFYYSVPLTFFTHHSEPIKRIALFDLEPSVLSHNPIVYIDLLFWGKRQNSLLSLSPTMVNNLVCGFIDSNFNDSNLIFTNGSVGISSACLFFLIPSLNISFLDDLHSFFILQCRILGYL